MNFSPFNAHTTTFFKNCNILKLADIINVESCVFINNCFNKDSFQILIKISNEFKPRTYIILDQLVMVYYLYQVITQSDLRENQLSIQPLLHALFLILLPSFSLLFFILQCCKVLFYVIFFLFFLKNYGKNSKNKEKKN